MGSRELRVGSPVLGYQVEALIGRGGMGVVYRVFDPALHRHVALKLIAPELALDEAFRERFLQESRAVAALEHPNVVPVYSAGQLEHTLYLAMRYVEGSDLRQLLADGPLPPERAIDICAQVAAALDAAHERGLVHRDVKPSNILVGDGDHVYLGDFGLSRRLDANVPAPGTSLGTIAYVAPEQIRGEQVDGRADCYSLACVLYECLAGEPPFAGRSDAAVLFAHLEAEPPTLPDLGAVFATGLAKDPGGRYGTCSELVDAARRALGLQPRRRRWPLAALTAAVIVAAAIGIGAVVRGHGGPRADQRTGRVVAIDSRSRKVVGPAIRIGDRPRGVAAKSDLVWVTTDGDPALWRIDARTSKATSARTKGPPTSVAVAARDAWVGDAAGVQQFAGANGRRVSTWSTLPDDPPFVGSRSGVVWATGNAGAANEDVYRIRRATGQAIVNEQVGVPEKVSVIRPPAHPNEVRFRFSINGIAAGPDGVWVVGDASDQRLWRVDGRGDLPPVELGFPPSAVADGDGSVWVTDQLDDRLAQIDPATGRIKFIPLPVGSEPVAVVAARSGVWVANALDDTVARIDPQRGRVTKTVNVPLSPTALAVAGDRIWVAGDAAPPHPAADTRTADSASSHSHDPMRIGVITDCSANPSAIAGAELPLLRRGGSLNGANPSDGVSMVTVAGRPVSLEIACAEGLKPEAALTQLRSLVEDKHVDAVVGPASELDPIVARYAKEHKGVVFMLTNYDQSSALRFAAPNVFRFEMDFAQWSAGLAAYAYHRLGWRNVTTVGENDPQGWAQAAGFGAEFCALGGHIRQLWAPFSATSTQLGHLVPRVSPQTDGVFLSPFNQADTSGFIRLWGRRHHDLARHLVGGWNTTQHGVVAVSPAPWKTTRAIDRYNSAFNRAFHRPDTGGVGLDYYDEVEPLLEALKQVKGNISNGERALRKALARLHYAGPEGPIHLDKRRQAVGSTYLARIGDHGYDQFKVVHNVDETFGGYFTPGPRTTPGPHSPACVKRTPPPWAARPTR